jgi:hypothetical protein
MHFLLSFLLKESLTVLFLVTSAETLDSFLHFLEVFGQRWVLVRVRDEFVLRRITNKISIV